MEARRGYAAGLGVLALAVGACTASGEEPAKTSSSTVSTSPSSSSTTSTTPSSTTSPSKATVDPADLPPEARKRSPEGAAAFVKYYVEQTNRASRTADPSILPPLADSGCKSCAAIQDAVERLQTQGRHYSSDPVGSVRTDPLPGGANGQQLVRLRMEQQGAKIVDSSGKVVDADKTMTVARTASVVWRGSTWIVYGIA
ncbi:hypothetical protein GCM10027517_28790 [Phycicoccus ginsengisoli]